MAFGLFCFQLHGEFPSASYISGMISAMQSAPSIKAPVGTPRGENFLVLPDSPIKTVGNIEIPESAQSKRKTGVVVKRGPKCPEDIALGTRVLWLYSSGGECEIDGERYLLMHETDIALVLPGTVPVTE